MKSSNTTTTLIYTGSYDAYEYDYQTSVNSQCEFRGTTTTITRQHSSYRTQSVPVIDRSVYDTMYLTTNCCGPHAVACAWRRAHPRNIHICVDYMHFRCNRHTASGTAVGAISVRNRQQQKGNTCAAPQASRKCRIL